jgi:uncharacterized protein
MDKTSLWKPAIVGLSIICTSFILGRSFKNRNVTQDAISVTGLGQKDFTSDQIYWSGSFNAKAPDAKGAYNQITEQKEKVKQFFLGKGFKPEEIVFSGVTFQKNFRTLTIESKDNMTKTEQVFDGYTASQSVSFSANKNPGQMKRIEDVAGQTADLINSGVEFMPQQIQYTYSDLPSLKHDLIEAASGDARERADKIVRTAHGGLGKLKDASMGVFQITGKGSVEEDAEGGNNDIYSKEKSARITVRLRYCLN